MVKQNQDLSAAINAATSAVAADMALPCTQTFTAIKSSTSITGTGGLNVICVGDVVLNGATVNLVGGASDSFVVKVTGKFVLNGSSKIKAVGVQTGAIRYDILGTGEQVAFTGGGGGTNCCNSSVDGTLVALQRNIALSPGLVNGQLIGGLNISIVSGSSVNCPCC